MSLSSMAALFVRKPTSSAMAVAGISRYVTLLVSYWAVALMERAGLAVTPLTVGAMDTGGRPAPRSGVSSR